MSAATVTITENHNQNAETSSTENTNHAEDRKGGRGLSTLASLVINFVVPFGAYYLIKAHVSSSALALAISGAIPVVYTLVTLAIRRRLDPLGVVSVVTFGIGVLISWASGGSALGLELQDPELTGLIGVAFLVSVAIGRPLHPIILRLLGRNNPHYADIATRSSRGASIVTTLVIGLALTVHAAAVATLALTEPTGTFVALQHVVGLPPVAIAFGGLFYYRSRVQAREAAKQADHDQPGQSS